MFTDVPLLGLIFGTLFCEFCASVGAVLTVGAWRGNVEASGQVVGLLLCVAALGCGVAASHAAARMGSKFVAAIVAAGTTLLWVIVVQAKGGLG
jgi:hypothetical protein